MIINIKSIKFAPEFEKTMCMTFERTFDILFHLKQDNHKGDILCSKKNGNWIKFSTEEYYQNALHFSLGLLKLGFSKRDKIITISNNRPEWNFVDMGMAMIGVVHVPVYPTISNEEFAHIFAHSDAKMIIVSDKSIYKKVSPIAGKIDSIEFLYSFNNIKNVNNWESITQLGIKNKVNLTPVFNNAKDSISTNDLCSIIYTSGTTGMPKGVMLSHQNFLSNVEGVWDLFKLDSNSRILSFLPLCHVFERMVNYLFQAKKCSIYYAENLGTIASDLKEIKATAFATVPRVMERIYDKIVSKGNDLSGMKKRILFWAMSLGENYCSENRNSKIYKLKLAVARKLVYNKWQQTFGGHLDFIISGGAALQPRLSRLFFAAGIPLMEGYGLTETAPVIATNSIIKPNSIMLGTVGPVLKNVTTKIDSDGEILIKGANVMCGYYKQPELTKEVIDEDGWFHTGDIGELVNNKFLKITDRKKEMFKTSSGKYIAPQAIENLMKESIFIEQAMVIGESEKFASALISPNFDHLHLWAHDNKVHFRDNKELVSKKSILKVFQKEISEINKKLGVHEQIKRFRIVCEPWTSTSGELSATLKLKRRVLYKKYAPILREIYSYEPEQKNKGSISFM